MAFRFIHTADWHLGRLFHAVSLLEDQAHLLAQLLALIRDCRPQALIVAGDVYDRAVPTADAVRLLDETLAAVTVGLGVPVVMIAGNHDSPERLGFGAALLAAAGCHIRGPFSGTIEPVRFADADGPVAVFPIPYAEPALVRECLAEPEAQGHDAAMAATLARLAGARAAARAEGTRTIAVAHCFAAGGAGSESERPLCVGGAGQVEVRHFAGFDYLALGHLHRPQAVGRAAGVEGHYAGSLFKYAFSEADHTKSVNLVELAADGTCRVERVPLSPRRDLRIIEGRLADLLAGPESNTGPGESREDYLWVRLQDPGPLLDPMGRLREVYPNVLHLDHPGLGGTGTLTGPGSARERLRHTEETLFAGFFEQVTGDPLGSAEAAAFAAVLEDLRRGEREGGA